MKRLLLIAALILALCAPAAAETVTAALPGAGSLAAGDFEYRLTEDGGAVITRYTGEAGPVLIPKELDGHPVTDVLGNPFCTYNEYGFEDDVLDCEVRTERDHPALAVLDGALFADARRRLVYCPPSVTAYAIPDGTETVGACAFFLCGRLTGLTIPDSVTDIGYRAFGGCTGLTRLTLPPGLTSVGDYAFVDCIRLADLRLPDGVTSIGESAFSNCAALTGLAIPDSVTFIGKSAFADCDSLTWLTLPDGLGSIAFDTFGGCACLTSVTIPDSVRSIGAYAFRGCTCLASVTVPADVEAIGEGVFDGCPDLVLTVVSGSYAERYCIDSGTAFVCGAAE